MYYIYDAQRPNEPYVFHDYDEGSCESAVFATEAQANAMCKMMNAVVHTREFKVAKLPGKGVAMNFAIPRVQTRSGFLHSKE